MEIFIDADACPVKEETFRVAERYGMAVHLVANGPLRVPPGGLVRLVVVSDGFDAADNWIADHCGPGDIAITADIQLAKRCLDKGAKVLGSNGRPFTPANIGGALASRALMQDLRDMGVVPGGNAPMSKQDKSRFLQELDKMANEVKRGR
ncbi:YaiI/YqxD family protein [Niveispirillum fermenti]|uniref:YaiI/YqxD family protein n=1 Tax=Niveispirillum fermenti TaxID=1233113 RepID=UPI003A8B6F5E